MRCSRRKACCGVIGLPTAPALLGVNYLITVYIDDALAFFAMVRLAQIVGEVEQAQADTAAVAITRERLRAAEELHAAIGERLSRIATMATAAERALPSDVARALTHIAAIGASARDAVAHARVVASQRGEPARQVTAPVTGGSTVIASRLAWVVLVASLVACATDGAGIVLVSGYSERLAALAIADIIVVVALQLYHSRPARAAGRPRAWPVTLGSQAVLVYAFLFPFVAAYVGGLAAFLAGSVLLLVRSRWRWAGYAAVAVSWSVLSVALPLRGFAALEGHRVAAALYFTFGAAVYGLVVYGLARPAGLARHLEALRGELAWVAVLQERLRIARDMHDLLGLGLSAIALKADLIGRLIGRGDTRAASEMAELSLICATARADIRGVTAGGQRLSLAAELAAARRILASAGVEVQAAIPPGPLPEAVDGVLATVLREAVTNILRHSNAAVCRIEMTPCHGGLRLRVSNDGAARRATASDRPPGHGLANLISRVHAAGGRLVSSNADGQFELLAEIPPGHARGLSPGRMSLR